MDVERMVEELLEKTIPVSIDGDVVLIKKDGQTVALNMKDPEDVAIFKDMYDTYVPENKGEGIISKVTDFFSKPSKTPEIAESGSTGPANPNQGDGQPSPGVRPGPGTEQDKDLAEIMGWDFDKHGELKPLRDWNNDPITGSGAGIDWALVEDILGRIIKSEDRSIVDKERKRAASARHDTREDAQAEADLRNQTDPGWLVTHEPTTDSFYIYKDFKPRFSVDAQGNQIIQTSEGGIWQPVEEEEEGYIPKTKQEYLFQLVSQGRYDEAAKFDQIMDQFEAKRMTPERAAEMLVNIAHNPVDFKDMMDAMLGRDSEIDTSTGDIQMLQAQSAAMLLDDRDPVLANALDRSMDLRTGPVSSEAQEFPSSGSYDPPAKMNPKISPPSDEERKGGPFILPDRKEFDRLRALDRNLIESGVPYSSRGVMSEGRNTPLGDTEEDDEKIFNKRYAYRQRAVDRDLISAEGYRTQGTYVPTEYQEGLGAEGPTFVQPGHPAWAILEASKQKQFEAAAKAKSDALDETYRKMYSKTNYPGKMNKPYESTEARINALRPMLGAKRAALFDINKRKEGAIKHEKWQQTPLKKRSYV
jgi:hypothetical protein